MKKNFNGQKTVKLGTEKKPAVVNVQKEESFFRARHNAILETTATETSNLNKALKKWSNSS